MTTTKAGNDTTVYGLVKPSAKDVTAIRVDCVYVPIIGNIDITSNTFELKVDVDLTWQATEEDMQKYTANPSTYVPSFVPDLVFINSMSVDTDRLVPLQGNVQYQIRNDRNYIRHRFIGKMVNNYRVENFPFDVQNLIICISISYYDKSQAYFEVPVDQPYVFVPRRFTALPGWELDRCLGGITDQGNFSTVVTVIQAKRIRGPYFFRIFSPLFVLNLATFSIYFVEDIEEKINILITSLLSFVGMIYILSSLVPMAGQTTLFDKYSMTSIAICVLGIFGNGWYSLYGENITLDAMFYTHAIIMGLYHLYFGYTMYKSILAANRKLNMKIDDVTKFYEFDPLTFGQNGGDKLD